MKNKFLAVLLACTVYVCSVAPSAVSAQKKIEAEVRQDEQRLTDTQTQTKSDLKTSFAGATKKNKYDTLTEEDFRRFEKESLFPQNAGQKKKKDRTILALVIFGAALTALVVVLATQPYKGPKECDYTPSNPLCPVL